MTYISWFSDFAFYFYYYFMENCHTWIIISMWQNDLHTNTPRSVWPILYGLMIKMLQYKMYPAGELAVLQQLLFSLFCFFTFIPVPLSSLSLFDLLYYHSYLFSPFSLRDDTKWPTRVDVSLNPNTINNINGFSWQCNMPRMSSQAYCHSIMSRKRKERTMVRC